MKYILSCVVLVSLSTSSLYAISWAKTFGGISEEIPYSICETSDGRYIVAGSTYSFGAGNTDFLVIKLNSFGNIEWKKTFGGTDNDYATSICETSDSGSIVAGWTFSFGAGGRDFLVIKLNSYGNIEWAKTFGGTDWDWASSICQTSDGGYIVAGDTRSFGAGWNDLLVIKLNSYGNIEWAKTFGDPQHDDAWSICETSDGGYIVAGSTGSFEAGNFDFLVIKLNSYGNIEWAKTFGGTDWDEAFSICNTSDNRYIVAGYTYSFGVDSSDFLVIKLNSSGNIEWAKTFGGITYDDGRSICKASDGGYIVAGNTESFEVDYIDFLVLKIQPDGSMGEGCPWYSVNPTVTSPTLSTTSPNLTVTSPNISSSNVSPTITSPNLSIYTICEALGEYDRDTLIDSPIIDVYTPYLDVIPLGNNKFYVKYGLPKIDKEFSINLSLYNLSGKLERILFSGKKSSGVYKMNLDLNDLPSGIYFLRLSFGSNYFDRKLIIQR